MSTEFEQSQKQLEELIGAKIELVISSGLYKGGYASRLEEVENHLVGVSHPMLRGALLPALRSTELLMKIEGNNCFYQATVSVARSTINVPIPLLWVKLVSALEKVQRRMFVRVPCSINAEVFYLGAGNDESEPAGEALSPPKEWFSARVSDISLGGVGLSVKKNSAPYCVEGGRYLLSMSIGGTAFFLVGKMVKILKKNESTVEAGLAYEGLTSFIEKLMGGYIRQQEFMTRG
ncbi:MAG: flagellar brake domain-containing protein [Synergistaceae bacterium]|jgi:c-di-GMP-binding flagellar brake protein YcgR|nr:flagellar brake domain-containing protein [Synergistaceae bacterium]